MLEIQTRHVEEVCSQEGVFLPSVVAYLNNRLRIFALGREDERVVAASRNPLSKQVSSGQLINTWWMPGEA